MDFASFVASLTTPQLRRDVLLGANAAMLARLPAALRAEATALRGRATQGRHRRRPIPEVEADGPALTDGCGLVEILTSEVSDLVLYHQAARVQSDVVRLLLRPEGGTATDCVVIRGLSRILSIHGDCCGAATFYDSLNILHRFRFPRNCESMRKELAAVAVHAVARLRHHFKSALKKGAELEAQPTLFVQHRLFEESCFLSLSAVEVSLEHLWSTLSQCLSSPTMQSSCK